MQCRFAVFVDHLDRKIHVLVSARILIGIYLDQKFTIPPLHEYALFKVFLEEGRKPHDPRKGAVQSRRRARRAITVYIQTIKNMAYRYTYPTSDTETDSEQEDNPHKKTFEEIQLETNLEMEFFEKMDSPICTTCRQTCKGSAMLTPSTNPLDHFYDLLIRIRRI